MTPATLTPWIALAALGAFHGVNPAMGWLFAVSLGLQDKRRGAVLLALFPIALGHAASIALVVAAMAAARTMVSARTLGVVGGLAVLAAGVYKLARGARHPRWVGMRVGFRDLVLWSFLMSSAHGAGLMLVPLLVGPGRGDAGGMTAPAHAGHLAPLATGASAGDGLLSRAAVLAVHSGAMLVVMGAIAIAVYDLFGVAFLRRGWINLDVLWATALVVAGALTIVMAA